jgi:hypothetical protein
LPRITVVVSEFTVLSHVSDGGHSRPRAEFALSGQVRAEGLDAEMPGGKGAHPLAGRRLSVSFSGGKKCGADEALGWIQVTPQAPGIEAMARIVCCPRRVASLRATAHHASGPLGGHLELLLEVAPAQDNGGGPVLRIPIRDAVIRATRRFETPPPAYDQLDGVGLGMDAEYLDEATALS